MLLRITGDIRTIAESAWISTLDEVRAKARTDEDVIRVVNLLVNQQHTSPLESISLTFETSVKEDPETLLPYLLQNPYIRAICDETGSCKFTIDLLNFVKSTIETGDFAEPTWLLFEKEQPELASILKQFRILGAKTLTPDADEILGDQHQMSVELVHLHNEGDWKLSRATWRVCCPLSISVQILRHRKASFNETSGRYRTLRQDIIAPVRDCAELFERIGLDLNRYLGAVDGVILQYNKTMRIALENKEKKIITNEEYKRIREFARFILPEGRMTELYITFYLDDFYNNYLVLRDSEHAQIEHMWVAQKMAKTLEEKMRK